jgi:hypothetical protein
VAANEWAHHVPVGSFDGLISPAAERAAAISTRYGFAWSEASRTIVNGGTHAAKAYARKLLAGPWPLDMSTERD